MVMEVATCVLFLQIVVSFSFIPPINSTPSPHCRPSQSFALLQFKNDFDMTKSASICGDVVELPMLQSWREGTNCCLWEGVECDESAVNLKSFLNLSASLKSLRLSDCHLHGKFPVDVLRFVNLKNFFVWDNPKLTITLPKSNWSKPLESSNLFNTSFSTENFCSVGNLKSLNSLYLDNCSLRLIPSCISNLTQITDLSLRNNNITGEIPTFFSNFKRLTNLNLYSNKFTGSIPSWLFNLSSLIILDLSNNHLTGEIREFQSKSIEYISLEQNMLHGPIPMSMFQLPYLTHLHLSYNNLYISTPNTIDINLPKLKTLDLSSCNITEFPMFTRPQDNLQWLDLSNNHIKCDIPQWMMNVGKKTLFYLNLSHNHFTGTLQLPWKKLKFLDLDSNMLRGLLPIPPPDISYILISKNNFSGKVSSLYCNLSSLEILDLSYNNLSGTIPSCLTNLTTILSVLNLRRNYFRRTIPTTFAKECVLRNLNLEGNQLEGKIPSSLVNCKDLEVLDLGHNMFKDEFPNWLKTLPMLRVLILRSNKLHCPLPNFAANDSFSNLQVLDLSTNSLVGHLPSLENLQAMANIDESDSASTYLGSKSANYDYSIALCVKGYEIEMQKNLLYLHKH